MDSSTLRTVSVLMMAGLFAGCSRASDEAAEIVDTSVADTASANGQAVTHNTLTPRERRDGWELLFDGASLDMWRGYGRDDLPETWVARDGEMMLQTEGGNMDGGDVVTVKEFTDFELVFDFKVGPSGNSGVFYRVKEVEGNGLWQVAPEYQVLDDPAYPESEDWDPRTHRTGENYDLQAAESRNVHPVGEWNTGRIIVEGNHVEHWLNGEMAVEYELYSPEWEGWVANSKFSVEEHFARAPSGAIGLQDHGTPVWYRNMKIRRLDEH